MKNIIVVGAGIGGLTAATLLARSGFKVTVLESHVYPGGCAGTFYHQGYRFDVGATLAGGFYDSGPMQRLAKFAGISDWQGRTSNEVMGVLMTSGEYFIRFADHKRHEIRHEVFGKTSDRFWAWQEETADAMWGLAVQLPSWPPQSAQQLLGLLSATGRWIRNSVGESLKPRFIQDAFRSISSHIPSDSPKLRQFVDAQLLISAQTTSSYANALYGASALDLPRRGVVNLTGGMGSIAEKLVDSIRHFDGDVIFRHRVEKVNYKNNQPVTIDTNRGRRFPADCIIFNLPPWNIASLLGDSAPNKLRKLPQQPRKGWGAYVVYLGVDENVIPRNLPLHNQIIAREPLGNGNSIFISISPKWDDTRAPNGKRAITISTHTRFAPWWDLYKNYRLGYESAKQTYTDRVLETAELLIPGIQEASELVLPGTPVTFERFTSRAWGWVGGFPQTNLFSAWGPKLGKGLWMVGDSIFPGQSVAATVLGGMRVAHDLEEELLGIAVDDKGMEYLPVVE